MATAPKNEDNVAVNSAVADGIIGTFIETLSGDAELAAVAARLKDTLLTKRSTSEANLRAALFEEDAP